MDSLSCQQWGRVRGDHTDEGAFAAEAERAAATRRLTSSSSAYPAQLFGFEPSWLAQQGGLPQPVLPEAPRGVRGTMSCIRSADGSYVTATLVDGGGVAYALDSTC